MNATDKLPTAVDLPHGARVDVNTPTTVVAGPYSASNVS
jgi:hypothetical protein